MISPLSSYLLIALTIALLWYLYFWLYKDFVVDVFRQKIFVLRDELFNDAAKGMISFDHPAYCVLRRTMNGYIRFTHQANLLNIFFLGRLTQKETIENYPFSFEKKFESSLEGLGDETTKKLRYYKKEARLIIATHLVAESPIIILGSFFALVGMIFPIIIGVLYTKKIAVVLKKTALGKIQNVESEAFSLGRL